ncbi:hypothetical protein KIH39_18460 [Telmatocola sphagniphila]|uniref:J domain-containing protein n=1 Tax=Telmatocola sphagniphila TaxID=1123043 RepID=A0A8E6EX26_9BACT|nr:J domain-containing protein [Telmatocola sphagniphila]QVL30821.1 hypothetical protein KIH39_18460 [Telmatocola sphagniphila]
MPPEDLPEDLKHWPANPRELFGLSNRFTREDLKRSYNKLIRRFRPEHHPEQFRKIREHYEFLQRFEDQEADDLTATSSLIVNFEPNSFQPAFTITSTGPEGHTAPQLTDFWQMAVDGQLLEAYRGLNRLVTELQATPIHYVQLYWLCELFSEVKNLCPETNWLYEGLKRFGWAEPLTELLRREIFVDATLVNTPEFLELKNLPSTSLHLSHWYQIRYRALWETSDILQFIEDFETLKQHYTEVDEDLAFRLVLQMFDYVAWLPMNENRASQLLDRILVYLNSFAMRSDRNYQLDRCESLQLIRLSWKSLQARMPPIPYVFEILAANWLNDSITCTADYLGFLNSMEIRPIKWLNRLEKVAVVAPVINSLLHAALMNELWRTDDSETDVESPWLKAELKRLLGEISFPNLRGSLTFRRIRQILVHVCLKERLIFERGIQALESMMDRKTRSEQELLDDLNNDLNAKIVCLAYRLAGSQ